MYAGFSSTLGRGIVFYVWLAAAASAHPGLDHDIDRATHAIADSPHQLNLRLDRARLFRLAGDHPASLADLDHVAAAAPMRPDVRLERGLTLAAMHRDDEAESELNAYLAEGGEAWSAFATRGRIHARGGRLDAAIEDLTAALFRRREIDLYLERGRLLESLGRLEEAADQYREGLSCLQGAVLIRLALVQTELRRDRYAAALELIDEALAAARVKTDWYLRRAEVLSAGGREQDAAGDRTRALNEAGRALGRRATPLNRYLRAKVYAAMGSRAEALTELEHVLKAAPAHAEAIALMAELGNNAERKERTCDAPGVD